MASKNNFQETHFSDSRKKVDISLVKDMKSQLAKNASEAQPGCKYNLRKSLAWDSAFFTNPGCPNNLKNAASWLRVLDQEELFATLDFRVGDNESTITSAEVQAKLFPFEYKEESTSGSTRKSLAWDSAFFTSPGVLDAEELCIVNRGFRRSKALAFPGATKEIWQSDNSSTSALSDTYSLASLEIDLFDNITTSVHNEPSPSVVLVKRETQNGPTSMVTHSSSGVKRNDGASRGKSNSLLLSKPPKISGSSKQQPSPNQTPPIGANYVKPENKVTRSAAGKSVTLRNKPSLSASCNAIPGSKPLGKITPSVSSTTRKVYARSSCGPSDIPSKSLPSPSRRMTVTGIYNATSTSKTPSKHYSRNKRILAKSNKAICSSSTPNSSSCSSPASSIDGWPSDSSTSWRQRPSKPPCSIPLTSPSKGVSFDSYASLASDSRTPNHLDCAGHRTQDTMSTKSLINKTSRVSPVASNVPENLRSSGLRMPSPKIGFFDTEDSVSSASKRGPKIESGEQKTPSKSEVCIGNINGSANRTGHSNHHLAGSSSGKKSCQKDEDQACLKKKMQISLERRPGKGNDSADMVVKMDEQNKENVVGFGYKVQA